MRGEYENLCSRKGTFRRAPMVPFNVMVHERNRWPTIIAASDCCHERPTASIVLAKSYVPQLYASVILGYKAKDVGE